MQIVYNKNKNMPLICYIHWKNVLNLITKIQYFMLKEDSANGGPQKSFWCDLVVPGTEKGTTATDNYEVLSHQYKLFLSPAQLTNTQTDTRMCRLHTHLPTLSRVAPTPSLVPGNALWGPVKADYRLLLHFY